MCILKRGEARLVNGMFPFCLQPKRESASYTASDQIAVLQCPIPPQVPVFFFIQPGKPAVAAWPRGVVFFWVVLFVGLFRCFISILLFCLSSFFVRSLFLLFFFGLCWFPKKKKAVHGENSQVKPFVFYYLRRHEQRRPRADNARQWGRNIHGYIYIGLSRTTPENEAIQSSRRPELMPTDRAGAAQA